MVHEKGGKKFKKKTTGTKKGESKEEENRYKSL